MQDEYHIWQPVAEHRITALERHRMDEAEKRAIMEKELSQVGNEMAHIKGGIDLLKWLIPVSITATSAITSVIAWLLVNSGGVG